MTSFMMFIVDLIWCKERWQRWNSWLCLFIFWWFARGDKEESVIGEGYEGWQQFEDNCKHFTTNRRRIYAKSWPRSSLIESYVVQCSVGCYRSGTEASPLPILPLVSCVHSNSARDSFLGQSFYRTFKTVLAKPFYLNLLLSWFKQNGLETILATLNWFKYLF